MANRPNIVYMHGHDIGRCISPYGFKADTPHLERFADDALVFRNAFSAAPTCSPSRAALLTGQSAHSAGMLGLAHLGYGLRSPRQHLLHTLSGHGYMTALAGMQHIAPSADTIGYDRVLTPDYQESSVENVSPVATGFLKNNPPEPFFLSVGFTEAHRPFHEPPAGQQAAYAQVPSPLPDTPETRGDAAAFASSLRVADQGFGAILDALEQARLSEHTLVIVTTDHGPAFPDMKCNLTAHGTGVMLMMRGPGAFRGPGVIDALVSQIDLFPTICEYLDIPEPGRLEGTSMVPAVGSSRAGMRNAETGNTEIRSRVFSECTYHVRWEPMRAIRTRRYSYIHRFRDHPERIPENCDDGPSKELWQRNGWFERPPAREELYDLLFDPGERRNLAGQPGYDRIRSELESELRSWMAGTEDPLLR